MAARPTRGTPPVRIEMPCGDVVPVAADEHRAAAGTVGGLTGGIVNIAGVDIVKAGIDGDLPCHAQRSRRRWRAVG